MRCEHQRKKRIFSHGVKSPSMLVCKDCGKLLKRFELRKEKIKNKRRKYFNGR